MITLRKLRWSNLFSYGEDNEVDFLKSPLTQIIGNNGFGKSSIALILEEVLYNKNSKGIKKSDILNRNSKSKTYSINLEFEKDKDLYNISTTRNSTQTVKILRNGKDISAHTATASYALIQDLIGYDHKTFAQIVYQSSASSLEFLTATDGNRKKFLIDLLNLTKYVEIGEVFKASLKEVTEKITITSTKIQSITDWIAKFSSSSLEELLCKQVPVLPKDVVEEISTIRKQIVDIDVLNKKIIQNNKYKEFRDNTIINPKITKPSTDLEKLSNSKAVDTKAIKDSKSFINNLRALHDMCPTCQQDIDEVKLANIIHTTEIIIKDVEAGLKDTEEKIALHKKELAIWNAEVKIREDYEKYHNLFDDSLRTELYDKKELETSIVTLEKKLADIEKEISANTLYNNKVLAHNAKIEVLKNQLQEMEADNVILSKELTSLNKHANTLQLLVKTFSPTGLVAYKIECLIKDLETVTNKYLLELSDGRFQLYFKIASADKLNVVITDNSKDIDITALSSGEMARVNTAALLGIRKLMQSLSNNRINLLILDETIENLDTEGKERLIEILLAEESLNTFVISHSFSHPLLERMYITKNNNISRIEDGR